MKGKENFRRGAEEEASGHLYLALQALHKIRVFVHPLWRRTSVFPVETSAQVVVERKYSQRVDGAVACVYRFLRVAIGIQSDA